MDIAQIIQKKENLIFKNYKENFEKFRSFLLEYNKKYNLTTILEEKDMFYKHFLDSVVGEFLFPEGAKVIEIGSGAGFPSLPIKIIRPDLSFTLVESVGKKCEFIKDFVDNFHLSNVEIYNGRAEDLAKNDLYREKYDVATARAVARMNTLSEYCIPFIKKGGIFVAYKSGDLQEVEEAKTAYKTLGGKLKDVISYSLPYSYGDRSLVVIEKRESTPKKYPRGQGKERKDPL